MAKSTTNDILHNQKQIFLHWYLTPFRISKFYTHASPLCWWQCGYVGTLYHILWDCPCIRTLWNKVFALLAQILNLRISKTPGSAILSFGIESFPKTTRMTHTLLSTRLSIMRHWKDWEIPTISVVVLTTNTHATYELMFASSQSRHQIAHRHWKPWTDWYQRKGSEYHSWFAYLKSEITDCVIVCFFFYSILFDLVQFSLFLFTIFSLFLILLPKFLTFLLMALSRSLTLVW